MKPDHDPSRTATWVYITVEDADEVSAELAHIDPDGNMLLFGAPRREG